MLAIIVGVMAWPGTVPARAAGFADPETPVTSTDLAVTAANNSPMFAADPKDGSFVVAAHRVDSPFFGCGLQLSGDAGHGWITANPVPTLPQGAEHCYAPEVAFDRKSVLHYLFVGLQGPGNEPMGVFLTASSDRGRTFDTPRQVLGPQNYMVRMVIDRELGATGRMHLVWLHANQLPPSGGLPTGLNPILSAHSDDGGRTFSDPVQVSDRARPRSVAPALLLGAHHAVHVAYYDLQDDARDYQGLEGPAWDGPWALVVSSSFDRGETFGPGVLVDGQLRPAGRVMLIYTMAPPAFAGVGSQLYASWPDASRNDDPDILLARSTDSGRSWAAPVRLNDDRADRAVTQELPQLSVAGGGRVDAAFLDRRNDLADRRFDVYYTYSTDAGATFAPNVRLTTESSDSQIGQRYRVASADGLVELGARIGLLSQRRAAVVAWPDTRNATFGTNQQDIFATRVTIGHERGGGRVALAGVGSLVVLLAAAVGGVLLRRSRSTSPARRAHLR